MNDSRDTSGKSGPPRKGGRSGRPPGHRRGVSPTARPSGPAQDGGRTRALFVLLGVERGRFAADLLAADEAPFVRELVLGVLRRRATLDAVHDSFSRRPITALHPVVRAALRLGLLQHLFLDGIPPHAAVSESVRLVNRRTLAQAGGDPGSVFALRGYVNGVLRSVLRESNRVDESADRGGASPAKRLLRAGRCVIFFSRAVFPDPRPEHGGDTVGYLAARHSHPAFLVQRWLERFGEVETERLLESANHAAALTLRPARHRGTALQLAQSLARDGIVSRLVERGGDAHDAVSVAAGVEGLFRSRAFREGRFAVQDAAQLAAAEILAPRAGEVVWDACAAPGTKSLQLAELLELAERQPGAASGGRIVATDASEERLTRLQAEAGRLGLSERLSVAVHDALSDTPPPGRPPAGFDAILLDAPCSNTAVLGRRPEARWRLRPDTFERLAERQRALLAAAARWLAPGGRLIYSICSLEPEELEEHGLRATESPLVASATREELLARAEFAAALERQRAVAAPGSASPPPAPSAFDWSGSAWAEPAEELEPEPPPAESP